MSPVDDVTGYASYGAKLTAGSAQQLPLNRDRAFAAWPHFDAGQWLDTNPGFVRLFHGIAWAVFTRYTNPPEPGSGSLWAVRVDIHMQPAGIPIPLLGQAIDPRVIRLGERVLIFYARIERDAAAVINGSSVALAEYSVDGEKWTMLDSSLLPKRPIEKELSAEAQRNWEKNWVPFAIGQHRVGLIYSHDPWDVIILRANPDEARRLESVYCSPSIQWDRGTIRGGTPPVVYDDAHLVTFFHAAQNVGGRNVYSVGACVFLNCPPYAPVLMTAEPLLIAPFKTGAHRFGWRFAGSVVFPLGCEATSAGFYLLCGRDDGEIAPFLVRRDELAARLGPPQRGPSGKVHDYRGGSGVRLSSRGLLYVPDPIAGIPELPMINFVRCIAGRGRTFVDVGSHIGFYTMGLAPGFQRVIAFEPSRFRYAWLRRNAVLNDYDHVQCEHIALGDTVGIATLNVPSYEGGLHSPASEVAEQLTIIDQYDVPVEVLDHRGLTDVDLLKIEVEGFEIKVLLGATQTIVASRPVILIEVREDSDWRRDVRKILDQMEYSLEFLFPASPKLAVCLPHERRQQYEWFI